MSTDLGKAYVQIMPSAKGISGSIQKALDPEASKAGKSAGRKIASSMAGSMGSAGGKLTKAITLPVAAATTAAVGLVGALGFKRLVGLDTAQAKLKGLGYNAKEVERISGQVETAIQDGMTTMGEGVDIAAGGLAAGVKEGKDLERYIKLVGDAAVGANRPVDEMAQIFNRVQGGGRLMTMELNMIEQGLPGFAQAMADEVAGGSIEAFREMVTAGEVGSEEFLNVMDDFAGGMAGAYSESWAGMAKNVLAYVGIIGEALLEGLFEDGKKGLANFIEVLKSDSVQEWATETGGKIRDFAKSIVESVKGIINWWTDLNDSTKDLIKGMAGFAVVLGPILLITSKIMNVVMSLAPLFKTLGLVIGAITSPIGLVVTAIAGAAALIYVYWEPISEFFTNLWESIKEIGISIWDTLKEVWSIAVEFLLAIWEPIAEFFIAIWEPIKEVWLEVSEFFTEIWMDLVEFFVELWEDIKETMLEVWEPILELWGHVSEFFAEMWAILAEVVSETWSIIVETIIESWNAIVESTAPIIEFLTEVITSAWNKIKSATTIAMEVIGTIIKTTWEVIKTTITTVVNIIKTVIETVWNVIKSVISIVQSAIQGDISGVWNGIKSLISSVMNGIMSIISSIWNAVKSVTISVFNGIKSIISTVINTIKSTISTVFNGIKTIITNVWNGIKTTTSTIWDGIVNAVKAPINLIIGFINGMIDALNSISIKLPKVPDWVPGLGGKGGNEIGFNIPNVPSLDVGTNYVAKDGLAMIHEGEAVVPKKYNPALNPIKANDQAQQPIILQVDGKTFAKITGDYTSQEGGKRIRRIERGLA